MKRGFYIWILLLLLTTMIIDIKSAPFDTGMKTFYQPNGVSFTGRIWGDEFIYWAETSDGYRYVQTLDGWYYYAALDQNGEYAPTNSKVGIDFPPSSSYQLERSNARMIEIQNRIEEFNEAIESNKNLYLQKQAEANAQGQTLKFNVGIILIQFPDAGHTITPERPFGYTYADFDSMMYSYNYWYAPDPQFDSPHPENELVFGSFRDYWYQISRGNLKIEGKVVNTPDENGVPEWITADHLQSEYATTLDFKTLAHEAIYKATIRGWINTNQQNHYDVLVIVFAQRSKLNSHLITYAWPQENYIQVSEQASKELYWSYDYTFTHMGVYSHEFGHILGFNDEYRSDLHNIDLTEDGGTDTYNFDLMSWGIYNGPLRKGECPATLSPYYRTSYNWVSPIIISENTNNFYVEYNYGDPKIYQINPENADGEYFFFESRGRDGFDKYIPFLPIDPLSQTGNLIIWDHDAYFFFEYEYTDRSKVINADNTRDWPTQLSDFFPSTLSNSQNFNDITNPPSKVGISVWPSSPAIGNLRPAHFALNGIHKLENGNTIIDEIRLNYATIKNIIGKWSLLSVPLGLDDYFLSSVFPTALRAYKYEPGIGLIEVDRLDNTFGYDINFPYPPPQVYNYVTLGGSVIDYSTIPVQIGWNLIGTISDIIPISTVCSDPPGIIKNIFNYIDGKGYIPLTEKDSLKPGIGYWVVAEDNGNVILNRNAVPGESRGLNLLELDKFTITDSIGTRQSLYVGNIDLDSTLGDMDLEMPPVMPMIQFDARFFGGEYLKVISADSGSVDLEIEVETNAYPITLSWELNPENGIEYSFINDSTLGKVPQITVGNGRAKFTQNSEGKIKLFGKVNYLYQNNQIPNGFELAQNFPNPFNPSTTIKYSISKTVNVELIVFDVLGREISTLVNETRNPGYYEVQFNASNLASGVYFYRFKAGDFVSSKKMMLVK